MKTLALVTFALTGAVSVASVMAQEGSMKGMDMPMKHSETMGSNSTLKPAQGASVKIISPKAGQHTLKLRVATSDHNTELDAMDKVTFTSK